MQAMNSAKLSFKEMAIGGAMGLAIAYVVEWGRAAALITPQALILGGIAGAAYVGVAFAVNRLVHPKFPKLSVSVAVLSGGAASFGSLKYAIQAFKLGMGPLVGGLLAVMWFGLVILNLEAKKQAPIV